MPRWPAKETHKKVGRKVKEANPEKQPSIAPKRFDLQPFQDKLNAVVEQLIEDVELLADSNSVNLHKLNRATQEIDILRDRLAELQDSSEKMEKRLYSLEEHKQNPMDLMKKWWAKK